MMENLKHPSYTPFAVITGASSGIGYELALQFAENGFDLFITAEDEGIYDVVQELEALGVSVDSLQVDLSQRVGVEQLYQKIKTLDRPVDAVALNAGVGLGGDFARDTDLIRELQLIDLNVSSTVHLAKLIISEMVTRGEGKVLFTSSIASTMPGPYEAVYAASKAFVQSFALSIREELKDKGVTVTSLMPGPTDTEIFKKAGMEDTHVGAVEKRENSAADVARAGFKGMMAGDAEVVAGNFKTQIMVAANKLLPESIKGKIHKAFAAPGSAPTRS